jgi:hypothetical protein
MLSLKQTTYPLFLACLVTYKIAAAQLHPDNATRKAMPEIEFGIDRSNMATEWTLSPPAEPNIYPFNGPYNGAGIFEARRIAVFDGIARLHPQWFRDGPHSMRGQFLAPALFSRSCCFHQELSTTSSATRATKSL